MDKLERIFELQKGFQDKLRVERHLDFTPEEWIQKQTLAMISELAELLEEVNFKWKTRSGWMTWAPVGQADTQAPQ